METKIIEINGVKLEVDLRTAKTVDSYKVGDSVKVLVKKYSDNYESHPGVIIGFDGFENLPTIIIAYLDVDYNEANIKMVYLNSESKDIEICPTINDELPISKVDVLSKFDRKIFKAEEEVRELKEKREYFINRFGTYFNKSEAT